MNNKLHVAGIQANLFWENPDKNINYFETEIEKLPNEIDVIVLPEMFTSGFTMKPENVAEEMDGKSVEWMKKKAKKKNAAIAGSIVIKENNLYYNRFLFVHPSGEINIYNKRHSFTLAGEDKAYTSGTQKEIINYRGWKICPMICYDLRFPVWSRNVEDYDVLFFVANWPVTRIKAWDTLLKARAIENMSYTIGVNRIGKDVNEYIYSGNSLIVDFLGNKLAQLPKNTNGVITAVLDKSYQNKTREKLGFLSDKDSFTIQ